MSQSAAYQRFLAGKRLRHQATGRAISPGEVSSVLYPPQRDIVLRACRKGRFAVFSDCGTGKSKMQGEWSRLMRPANGRAFFCAPNPTVARQTIEECRPLGITLEYVTAPSDAPYQITNIARLHHFVGVPFDTFALDESSILKSLDGKTRTMILREFTSIPMRTAWTATPAPNDISELANHAEFIGAMSRVEMLAAFFVHDPDGVGAGGWRLKGHAEDEFWRWVATWAVYVRQWSDLGFDNGDFVLPELEISERIVDTDYRPDGHLFAEGASAGIGGARRARRASIDVRVAAVKEEILATDEQAIVWCGLNSESDAITEALGDWAVNVEGATDDDERAERIADWLRGDVQTLVTKDGMLSFGMNFQHCHREFFLGIGHSFERYYQAIRRCWRYGQKHKVTARIVVSSAEVGVAATVRRKEADAQRLSEGIVAHMKDAMLTDKPDQSRPYAEDEATGEGWRMLLGDAVERITELETASVGLSVFSPPFASLYTYSASDRDMGNSKDYDQFFEHFGFLARELLRVIRSGRRCCVHVQQVMTTKATHGVIGWRDFRADVVKLFTACGFVYDGEVVIDKDPQAQAIRTKSKALMFVQKNKDSAWSRPAMADYILLFRTPGDNAEPVKTDVSNEEWILWARPIWYGIRESETLNAAEARSNKDERHIAPLQLETIERCVRLWSNRGDVVLSPFGGIGSEGYVALQHGRRYVGIELNEAYWRVACRNLQRAQKQLGLFGAGA